VATAAGTATSVASPSPSASAGGVLLLQAVECGRWTTDCGRGSAMFGNMLQKIDAIAVFPSYCCCSCTQYLLLQAAEEGMGMSEMVKNICKNIFG